jgi:hypothetical protein
MNTSCPVNIKYPLEFFTEFSRNKPLLCPLCEKTNVFAIDKLKNIFWCRDCSLSFNLKLPITTIASPR